MPKAGVSHDVTIEDVAGGSTVHGFMYFRKNGKRPFIIRDARTVRPRVLSMGELTEAEFPAEYAQYWSQEDWRAGLGGINHRHDPLMIASGNRVSTKDRGKLRPARNYQNSTQDTAPDRKRPSGFAMVGTELWSFSGRDVYSHPGSSNEWAKGTLPYQADIVMRNGVEFKGKTYVATSFWNDSRHPGSYMYKADADSNWTVITFDHMETGNPSVACKYFAKGRNAAGDEILWGANWAKWAPSGTNTSDWISLIQHEYQTTLVVTDHRPFSTGDIITFSSSPLRPTLPQELQKVGDFNNNGLNVTRGYEGTQVFASSLAFIPIWIRTHPDAGKIELRSTSDPTAHANWSSAISIGESSAPITGLVADGDTVKVCKTNGVWAYYPDGTVRNLTPAFETTPHPDHFKGATLWNGRLLLPLGTGGLLELRDGVLYDISMSKYAPNETTLHGRVVAIATTPSVVYLMIDDATNTNVEIISGRLEEINGVVDYRWQHEHQESYSTTLDSDHCTLFADGFDFGGTLHRRIWIGVVESDEAKLPAFLPYDDDTDDGYTPATSAIATFTRFDGNLPKVEKTLAQIDIRSTNLGAAGRQYTIEYSLDEGTYLVDLTDAGGNADGVCDVSPTQTLTFPAGTTCKILEIRAKPTSTAATTTPPEINDFRVTWTLRADALKLLPMDVYLADNQVLLNGALGGRPKLDLAQLETWDSQAAEVTVKDPRGSSRDMVFLPGSMIVEEVRKEPTGRPEYRVKFMLVEV